MRRLERKQFIVDAAKWLIRKEYGRDITPMEVMLRVSSYLPDARLIVRSRHARELASYADRRGNHARAAKLRDYARSLVPR